MTDAVARVFREGGDFLDMLKAEKEYRMSKHVRDCKYSGCNREFETNDSRQFFCCAECRRAEEYAQNRAATERRRVERERNSITGQICVSDPFTRPDFYGADGLPGMHSQVCPMEGMYSQPEHGKGEAA